LSLFLNISTNRIKAVTDTETEQIEPMAIVIVKPVVIFLRENFFFISKIKCTVPIRIPVCFRQSKFFIWKIFSKVYSGVDKNFYLPYR
jgi:hypothetical protein